MRITTVSEQLERARNGAITKWLVDGVLVAGGYTMIYGLPGCGKSLVALDLALAASEGRQWLGVHTIERQPVLYVDDDGNNDSEMNARLVAFGASEENAHLHLALHNGFKITDDAQRQQMIDWCRANTVGLVIFDSFARMHDLAESNADSMKVVTSALKNYTLAGISVVVLHHASRSARSVRGSTEIESGPDAIYRMERVDDATFRMVNAKARSVGSAGVWRGCDVQVGKDIWGCLALSSQPLDAPDHAVVKTSSAETKRCAISVGIVNLLAEGVEMTETAISARMGLSGRYKNILKDALADLTADDAIRHEKRGKGHYYQINPERWEDDAEKYEDFDHDFDEEYAKYQEECYAEGHTA